MKRLIQTVAAAIAMVLPAYAQTAPAPVRGTVATITEAAVTLTKADGSAVNLNLAPTWIVQVMKPIGIDAIQPGSFIGTAEMPQADGTGRSLEVHVFPPGVKVGEGHYAWDLKDGSMMTNGTVGEVTESPDGRTLVVNYPNGSRKIVVPPGVPIVQINDGTRDLVKVGVPVFVIAIPGADGVLSTFAIAVGENGAAPPM